VAYLHLDQTDKCTSASFIWNAVSEAVVRDIPRFCSTFLLSPATVTHWKQRDVASPVSLAVLTSMPRVPLFAFTVSRVCCCRECHCVVTMWYSVVLLERCLGVSCVLCVVDFLLTFRKWLLVACLCKCELHFKVTASVVGVSCSAAVCVFYGQRNCETRAPTMCLTGDVNFI
jgi:hypothetical protein